MSQKIRLQDLDYFVIVDIMRQCDEFHTLQALVEAYPPFSRIINENTMTVYKSVLCNILDYHVFEHLYDLIKRPRMLDKKNPESQEIDLVEYYTWPQFARPLLSRGATIKYAQSMHMNDYHTLEDPRMFNHRAYYPPALRGISDSRTSCSYLQSLTRGRTGHSSYDEEEEEEIILWEEQRESQYYSDDSDYNGESGMSDEEYEEMSDTEDDASENGIIIADNDTQAVHGQESPSPDIGTGQGHEKSKVIENDSAIAPPRHPIPKLNINILFNISEVNWIPHWIWDVYYMTVFCRTKGSTPIHMCNGKPTTRKTTWDEMVSYATLSDRDVEGISRMEPPVPSSTHVLLCTCDRDLHEATKKDEDLTSGCVQKLESEVTSGSQMEPLSTQDVPKHESLLVKELNDPFWKFKEGWILVQLYRTAYREFHDDDHNESTCFLNNKQPVFLEENIGLDKSYKFLESLSLEKVGNLLGAFNIMQKCLDTKVQPWCELNSVRCYDLSCLHRDPSPWHPNPADGTKLSFSEVLEEEVKKVWYEKGGNEEERQYYKEEALKPRRAIYSQASKFSEAISLDAQEWIDESIVIQAMSGTYVCV